MFRACFSLAVILATSFAAAAESESLTGTYRSVTVRAPDELSVLKLTHKGGDAYAIDMQIVAPNPRRHTGQIQGEGLREGDTITMIKENRIPETGQVDHPPKCTLKIRVAANAATVLSEQGCAAYHGAAASFVEQGAKLIRD